MPEERKHFRPNWDDYFMAIAKLVAARGTCDRLYAGAVLVKNKRIIGTGYNSAPPGLPRCDEVGHLIEENHCVRTIHAEHNALLQAARQGGTSTENTTLYLKYSPCIHCTKYIIACGVTRVVMGKEYRNPKVSEMLKEAGVQVDAYKENPKLARELVQIFSEDVPTRVNEGEIKLEIEK